MPINFPSSLDTLTNPTSSDTLSAVPHATQHANANDAIEALEAKVGIDSSVVTTSHDYKLGGVSGSDKAVSKTGTETLTNKTLTSPVVNFGSDATGDIYYRNSSGALVRLPIGASGQITTVSGGVPVWADNAAAADASTSQKGVAEEATLAETLARTGSGSMARLYVNPTNLTTVSTYDYAASSGGSDTYAITVTPIPTAYVTGQVFRFLADVANTGAATLNVNSLGAKTIKKNVSVDLENNDILASQIVEVIYDGTNFQLLNRITNGTTRIAGIADPASTSETTVFTTTVTGGLLSKSGMIRTTTPFYIINTSSGGTFTLRLKYGGSTLSTIVITASAIGGGSASSYSGTIEGWIINNASLSSQNVGFYSLMGLGLGATSGVAISTTTQPADTTSSVNTASDQTLALTVQKSGSSGGSMTAYQTLIETKSN